MEGAGAEDHANTLLHVSSRYIAAVSVNRKKNGQIFSMISRYIYSDKGATKALLRI